MKHVWRARARSLAHGPADCCQCPAGQPDQPAATEAVPGNPPGFLQARQTAKARRGPHLVCLHVPCNDPRTLGQTSLVQHSLLQSSHWFCLTANPQPNFLFSSRMRFGGWLPTLMGDTQCWVCPQGQTPIREVHCSQCLPIPARRESPWLVPTPTFGTVFQC